MGAICSLPVLFGVGCLVGAMLLRAAIRTANRLLGFSPDPGLRSEILVDVDSLGADSGMVDESNPFAVPKFQTVVVDVPSGTGIPFPGFWQACQIAFVNGLLSVLLALIANLLVAIPDFTSFQLLILTIVAVDSVVVYKLMLPTSLDRAIMVFFLQMFIGALVIAIVVGIVLTVSGI